MAHRLDKPKYISKGCPAVIKRRLKTMIDMREEFSKLDARDLVLSISEGNVKTGYIPSISLIPIEDCPNCSGCCRLCYDIRNDCNEMRQSVQKSRAKNSAILRDDFEGYWSQLNAYLTMHRPRAFRYHIGGDIASMEYLKKMVELANNHDTVFFCFTKQYDLINEYLSWGKIPDNLRIIFSIWPGMECDNPYNMPTAHILWDERTAKKYGFEQTTAPAGAFWCPGDCTECYLLGEGCMNLKRGEAVLFPAH